MEVRQLVQPIRGTPCERRRSWLEATESPGVVSRHRGPEQRRERTLSSDKNHSTPGRRRLTNLLRTTSLAPEAIWLARLRPLVSRRFPSAWFSPPTIPEVPQGRIGEIVLSES